MNERQNSQIRRDVVNHTDIPTRLAAAQTRGETVYLLFDGAYPDMQGIIYRQCDNPIWEPLWLGTPYAHMLDISPGLITLNGEDMLLDWYLSDGARSNAGVLLASPKSLETVAAHFRTYLEVVLPDAQKRVVLFRFFSPLVLDEYLPSLTPLETANFLAPCHTLWWPQTLSAIRSEGSAPAASKQQKLSLLQWQETTNNHIESVADTTDLPWHYGFRVLSAQSYAALVGSGSQSFVNELKKDVLRHYPNLYRLIDEQGFNGYLVLHLEESEQAGISAKPANVERLLWMRFLYGWHFWDELQFMRGNRNCYEVTPLTREALNAVMPFLAALQRDVEGLGTRTTEYGRRRMRKEAASRVRPLYFSERGSHHDALLIEDILEGIYPERANFMGDKKLAALVSAATHCAVVKDLPESTGGLCCALLFLFFGLGAFEDPLLKQWLDRLFAVPQESSALSQWGDALLKNCCADISEWGSL
jgi:hypothetical protein